MQLYINGYSLLGGHNLPASLLLQSVLNGDQAFVQSANDPAPTIATEDIEECFPSRSLRQLGHYERATLLGVSLALRSANITDYADTAIVLATGYGPAQPTFDFLDSILNYGQTLSSPLAFSHSVQNIPAAVLAQKLSIEGPCHTVCQLNHPVATAFRLAHDILHTGLASTVLLAAIDEVTAPLRHIRQALLQEKIDAHDVCTASLPLGENAAFFCLSAQRSEQSKALMTIADSSEPFDVPAFYSGPPKYAPATMTFGAPFYGQNPINHAVDCALALSWFDRLHWTGKDAPQTIVCQHTDTTGHSLALSLRKQ